MEAPPPVKVTDCPAHIAVDVALAVTVGKGFTVIVLVAVELPQPMIVPVTV